MRDQLCFMHRQYSFSALEFHNDSIFDKKIYSIANVKLNAIVLQRETYLRKDLKPCFSKLVNHARFIGAFEKSRP